MQLSSNPGSIYASLGSILPLCDPYRSVCATLIMHVRTHSGKVKSFCTAASCTPSATLSVPVLVIIHGLSFTVSSVSGDGLPIRCIVHSERVLHEMVCRNTWRRSSQSFRDVSAIRDGTGRLIRRMTEVDERLPTSLPRHDLGRVRSTYYHRHVFSSHCCTKRCPPSCRPRLP